MKLIYKGKYSGESELPIRNVPSAVRFREPDSMKKLAVIANGISLAVTMICLALALWRTGWDFSQISFVGMALSLLTLYPHEILHALCFRETVYFFTNWKQGLLFVVGTEDMTKTRFVLMSLLPNIVFGLIPFLLYMICPQWNVLGWMGVMAIGCGAGDYLNVFNALTQVPHGARTYMSGMHSYWYMPGREPR